MESTLIAIAAGATLFAIVVVVISARRWNARIRSAERVETLQTLVAEAAQSEQEQHMPRVPQMPRVPKRTHAKTEVREVLDLRPIAPPLAVAPTPAVVQPASAPMFSVTVPDAGGRHQMSFARGRQHDDVQA
jgi:hypothetical protein